MKYCRNCGTHAPDSALVFRDTEEFGKLPFCNNECYEEWLEDEPE